MPELGAFSNFVAVDPSISETGLCAFVDGKPVAAWRVTSGTGGVWPRRVTSMANRVQDSLAGRGYSTLPRLIEMPQIYMSTPNPENILLLTLVVGRLTQNDSIYVRPRKWKGNVKKDVMTRRIAAQVKKEFPDLHKQLAKVPAGVRHNALDAVGIGLWYRGLLWRKSGR